MTRPRGLPEQTYKQALESIRELHRREKFAATAYQRGALEASGAYLGKLQSVIGRRNVAKYRALRNRSMREVRASIDELPRSQRVDERLRKIRKAQVRKSADQIRALGVDLAEVRRLQKEFRKGKEALLEATLERGGISASRLPKKKNTTAKPPFDGWAWELTWYDWAKYSDLNDLYDQGLYDKQLGNPPTATPSTGNVACNHGIGVKNADDYDEFIVTARAAVAKWFQMPQGSQLNSLPGVRVRAKLATKAKYPVGPMYDGYVDAFFGSSSVDVHQRMDLYARIHLGFGWTNMVTRNILDYQLSTGVDYEWDNPLELDFSGEGNWIGPTPYYGYPVGPGYWVLVEAGILYTNHFTASNAEVYSHLRAAANIEEIGLTAEYAP